MTFQEFQTSRERMLREQADLIDCSETNLYRALNRLAPSETPPPAETVHRCHLATAWTELFGLPETLSKRALISSGVRDSLARVFRYYSQADARVWLPEDNYPVFGDLARDAGLAPETFPTLQRIDLPEDNSEDGPEILLLTNPIKPAGRWLDTENIGKLRTWLAGGSERRLLIDTVYTFGTRFDPGTLELLGTGKTILLHSLTKGWLSPRLFGIALVPEPDWQQMAPLFRENPPSQTALAHARQLMGQQQNLPEQVAGALLSAAAELKSVMPAILQTDLESGPARYLFPVAGNWLELTRQNRILGLPASAFGSKRDDITILSSLNFVQ